MFTRGVGKALKIARTPASAPLNYPRRCVTLFYSFSTADSRRAARGRARALYNKAVECYALGRPLPSIDAIGWEGVFTTPCANFPVVAGLP